MNLTELIVELGHQGLVHAETALVVQIAKAMWYSTEIPNLEEMSEVYRNDVGYVIDRLARFNVVPKGRKLQLLAAIEPFRCKSENSMPRLCKDPLAVEWGATGDLSRFIPDLMPLQTRHYAKSVVKISVSDEKSS